jgi:hypothetical protein
MIDQTGSQIHNAKLYIIGCTGELLSLTPQPTHGRQSLPWQSDAKS